MSQRSPRARAVRRALRDALAVVAGFGLRTWYRLMDLFPRSRRKVVFLSRQSDSIPPDFELLIEALRKRFPDVRVAAVGSRFNPDTAGPTDYLWFGFAMLRSLYHLATSKVAVLDAYWPAVSMVDLSPSITVFQMWHSLGKIKKSGLATVGREHGRTKEAAEAFAMHQGYDFVVAGAPFWNQYYIESFGVSQQQLLNIGLPRAAYLVNEREAIAKRIYAAYPELKEGRTVLYAPTFRRGGGAAFGARRIVNNLSKDGWTVIVKGHANQALLAPEKLFLDCPDFTAPELLTVADYLVTDYSAIALEAALLDVPTYYYLYDIDEYLKKNGLNIDIEKEMPGCTYRKVRSLRKAMRRPYPVQVLQSYKSKYALAEPEKATDALVDALFEQGGLCQKG